MAGIDNNTLLYLSGGSIVDSSLTPKTITNNGVTVNASGKFGSCLNFATASNQYISIPNTNNIFTFGTNDFTIDFWINFSSFFDNQGIFTPIGDTTWVNLLGSWHLVGDVTGAVTFSYFKGTTASDVVDIRTSALALNNWYHIALVRKSNIITLYLNGISHGYLDVTTSFIGQSKVLFGKHDGANNFCMNGKIDEFRISNVARYTTDFTPPTQPYSTVNINVTSQTATNVAFNVSKLGTETINKVEVYLNNVLSQTYTSNYSSLNYAIDNSKCAIGNNNIKIKVTYDTNYTEEKALTHSYTVLPLPTNAGFKAKNDRDEILYNSLLFNRDNLKTNLTNKGVDVTGVNEMSILIDKVNELEDKIVPLYLYKDGDECIALTGGWSIASSYGTSSTLTKGSSSMRIYNSSASSSNWNGSRISTISTINMQNYSKIKFDIYVTGTANIEYAMFGIATGKNVANGSSATNDFISRKTINPTSNFRGIIELPTSSSTSIYVSINNLVGGGGGVGSNDIYIYKIWLEK